MDICRSYRQKQEDHVTHVYAKWKINVRVIYRKIDSWSQNREIDSREKDSRETNSREKDSRETDSREEESREKDSAEKYSRETDSREKSQ